ncbi:hypothetical protein CRN74_09365 [Yersinia frederiksenii]|nr:hypothetical protein CRN74_09365 [Yersinia frederiksenii]
MSVLAGFTDNPLISIDETDNSKGYQPNLEPVPVPLIYLIRVITCTVVEHLRLLFVHNYFTKQSISDHLLNIQFTIFHQFID